MGAAVRMWGVRVVVASDTVVCHADVSFPPAPCREHVQTCVLLSEQNKHDKEYFHFRRHKGKSLSLCIDSFHRLLLLSTR